MKIIFIIILFFSLTIALDENWKKFKAKHGVKFERNLDENISFLNYKINQIKRDRHNADVTKTFMMNENKFSHMSYKQFSDKFCKSVLPDEIKLSKVNKRGKRQVYAQIVTLPPPTAAPTTTTTKSSTTTTKAPSINTNIFGNYTSLNVPPSVDYSYLMQPVLDQKDCGSCWALAAMSQIEAIMKFRNPYFNVQLSPQILLDCDFLNAACVGGWSYDAMKWLRSSAGGRNMAPSTDIYPYIAADGTCTNDTSSFISLGLKTSKQLNYADEATLMLQVANCGPQVVAFYVSDSFQHYSSGVFSDSTCFSGTCDDVNHSMVVVGYGMDPVLGPYWLCKNTWGSDWGENGYIRVARDNSNMCNIACFPAFTQ